MKIYRRRTERRGAKKWLNKSLETTIKAAMLLTLPLLPALVITLVWYLMLYKNGIHFSEGMSEIATTAWISIFGIFYALLAAIVLNTVWSEYKEMRMAIKRYDIETFMNLRDEDMSPLVHVMMAVLSWAVLGAFLFLPYPDPIGGLVCVGSTAYLFGLIFFVVVEIDNPLVGIWFIKSIHEGWLEMDVKEWRQNQYHKKLQITVTEVEDREEGAKKAA